MGDGRREFAADVAEVLALGLALATHAPGGLREFLADNPLRGRPPESEAMKAHKERLNAMRWRAIAGGDSC